ncbi:GIY-YIG nuclease family protein [Serratia marcescens]|uniref:GIY-YIG nuclease family protein n=1 Tax=Serratia marcescens TaxID=615 RepID=UPI002237F8F6|nr:GIY-YIG nuclease family protein [Serratia marcescens]MCW6024420.1 GIY-YIG nuclease family protein [Serratia marcescens]
MIEKTINLEFDGYWRDEKKALTPDSSGIYCVYAAIFNESKKTVSIKRLIYIGESESVKHRLANHERSADWKKHLKSGEILCYSVAEVPGEDRLRCKALLINHTKPPENSEYTADFPHNKTTINTTGCKSWLPKSCSSGNP